MTIGMLETSRPESAPEHEDRHDRLRHHPDDGRATGGIAAIGSTVRFIDLEHDVTLEYELVPEIKGDPARGKLSVASPLGRALLGRRATEIVEVESDARGRGLLKVRAVSPRVNQVAPAGWWRVPMAPALD